MGLKMRRVDMHLSVRGTVRVDLKGDLIDIDTTLRQQEVLDGEDTEVPRGPQSPGLQVLDEQIRRSVTSDNTLAAPREPGLFIQASNVNQLRASCQAMSTPDHKQLSTHPPNPDNS